MSDLIHTCAHCNFSTGLVKDVWKEHYSSHGKGGLELFHGGAKP